MSRSRTGCITCRRRHRKCDERKPTCWNCEAQEIECGGYNFALRWDVGTRRRRHLTKSSTAHNLRDNISAVKLASSQTSEQLENILDGSYPQERNSNYVMDQASSPSTGSSHALPPTLSQQQRREEDWLVNDFFRENIHQLYATRRDDNLADMLHKLTMDSEALRAILAGMHLYLENPADVHEDSETYHSRGLALFRNQLETYNGSLDASVLTAGLLICTMSLYQGVPWTSLLEHMINVYQLRHHLVYATHELIQPSVRFAVEAMGVMDMPSFVRGRESLTHGIWTEMRTAQRTQGGDFPLDGVETMSGLPRSLLDIFAALHEEDAESRLLAWPGEVGDVPAMHLWEAYRCAGILTNRRMRRAGRIPSTRALRMEPKTDAWILLGRLVTALDALFETRGRPEFGLVLAVNAVFYPLVAARLEVSLLRLHPAWSVRLRHIHEVCQPYSGTTNAQHVAEMLDEAWETNNDDYDMDAQARRRDIEIALF